MCLLHLLGPDNDRYSFMSFLPFPFQNLALCRTFLCTGSLAFQVSQSYLILDSWRSDYVIIDWILHAWTLPSFAFVVPPETAFAVSTNLTIHFQVAISRPRLAQRTHLHIARTHGSWSISRQSRKWFSTYTSETACTTTWKRQRYLDQNAPFPILDLLTDESFQLEG